MFRRGKRGWRIAALAGVLLVSAGTGRAMAWQGPSLSLTSWESTWEWMASWFGGHHAVTAVSGPSVHRGMHEKSSARIDPNGLTTPSSSVQSDSSLGIDPNGHH